MTEDNFNEEQIELTEEQQKKMDEMTNESVRVSINIIASLLEKEDIPPVNLSELVTKYSILVGEDSDQIRGLLKYASFLEKHLVTLLATNVFRAKMADPSIEFGPTEQESSSDSQEGISDLDFDFEGKKENENQ